MARKVRPVVLGVALLTAGACWVCSDGRCFSDSRVITGGQAAQRCSERKTELRAYNRGGCESGGCFLVRDAIVPPTPEAR